MVFAGVFPGMPCWLSYLILIGLAHIRTSLLNPTSEHKYEIVKRLQVQKHICGITGDGVNDAPALEKANTGIAMANSADAARRASDQVLMQPGLSVIIATILTSHAIFQRVKNYTVNFIVANENMLKN